jgi:uncharacterized protein (DUF488 family)
MNPVFTIGHSTHTIEVFVELLKKHQVDVVADVRSAPYSGRYPQFSRDPLGAGLKQAGIQYVLLGRELGARREERECYVEGQAKYEKIARTAAFLDGIARVLKGADTYRIALMCAEQDPLTCHRTILICRHLKASQIPIQHILRDGNLEPHEEVERRLMLEEREDPDQHDMFCESASAESALERAYTKRGERIAYREGQRRE